MDLSTVIGLAGNTILMLIVMQLSTGGGSILMYWDFLSILIVLGGSALATLTRWPLPQFIAGFSSGTNAIFNRVDDPTSVIAEIIELARTARKSSILALEKVPITNKFLAKCVRFMVDGYDPAVIDGIIDIEIDNVALRHKYARAIFENMGEGAPAFGMIGTVLGLVVIMANLSDPDKIGPGLAVALITTLYGAMLTNVVFSPLASKLKFRAESELTNMFIVKEGVKSMLGGENPNAIQEKLDTFVAS